MSLKISVETGGVRQDRVTTPWLVIYTQWFVLAHLLAFSG